MKCHYEILDVPRDVNNEDLKKAYRKAALKWHPDKNLSSPELAKEQFQLVQQAYEVLSDSNERAWYDAHRDAILKGGLGGDYKDDSLDVFPYFTTSCFKGFGDDDGGFYSVYREVFNKIAAEDSEYMEDGDSDFEIPSFGNSSSDFKEVVQPFYAYWQDYSTKKSFSWLDQCDIRDLPNRRVAKLVERENKKIRDKARKERNEQIRNLVAFVRKRDKRVQAQAEIVKAEQAQKALLLEEKRKKELRERLQQAKEYKETEWSKFSNVEDELKNIEKSLRAEHGEEDSYSEGEEDGMEDEVEDLNSLYCPACQKLFKTDKAFSNHEQSKKHKENVEILRQTLLDEEEEDECEELSDEELDEEELDEETDNEQDSEEVENEDGEEDGESGAEVEVSDQNGKRETNGANNIRKNINESDEGEEVQLGNESDDSDSPQVSLKSKKSKNQSNVSDSSDDEDVDEFAMLSKKQRRKLQQQRVPTPASRGDSDKEDEAEPTSTIDADEESTSEKQDNVSKTKLKGKKAKEARKLQRQAEAANNTKEGVSTEKSSSNNKVQSKKSTKNVPVDISVIDTEHVCATCASNFSSKNKLFDHLKKTKHSVFIPKATPEVKDEKKKGKGKRK